MAVALIGRTADTEGSSVPRDLFVSVAGFRQVFQESQLGFSDSSANIVTDNDRALWFFALILELPHDLLKSFDRLGFALFC